MDHSAIFALIAGTYTPFLLVVARNVPAAIGMWVFAVSGIAAAIAGNKARKRAGGEARRRMQKSRNIAALGAAFPWITGLSPRLGVPFI